MLEKDEFIKLEGKIFPGKTYVEHLLKPVFNDQRDYLFGAMFSLHQAHVVMLTEQGLLSQDDAQAILTGLKELDDFKKDQWTYDPTYEDLFFMVEAKLGEKIGTEMAGKMHLARSRNDMGEGMYRIIVREHLLALLADVSLLAEAILEQASKHVQTIMPAHTHTQPAQPTTFGHYLLAIFDQLMRDTERLWQAYHTVNKSPLGAAAITTTGFPISRERLMVLLGFDGMIENSYDAIATGDYLLTTAQGIVSLMVNTGRWIQEFLRFASREVDLIKVADPYVQISSIMPQKRNPVSIEHSRALASNAVGNAQTVIQMLHNTPYGDINDTEDDLQPTLLKGFFQSTRVMRLMYAVIRTMDVHKDHALAEARKNLITITELADTLTRDYHFSFRSAHTIASKIARKSIETKKELFDWTANDINAMIPDLQLSETEWQLIIDPAIFIKRRNVRGGPNVDEVKRMVHMRAGYIQKEKRQYDQVKDRLHHAKAILQGKVSQYIAGI